jgi:hypothetical protein
MDTSSNVLAGVDREGNYRRLFLSGHCVRGVEEHFERLIKCEDSYR